MRGRAPPRAPVLGGGRDFRLRLRGCRVRQLRLGCVLQLLREGGGGGPRARPGAGPDLGVDVEVIPTRPCTFRIPCRASVMKYTGRCQNDLNARG